MPGCLAVFALSLAMVSPSSLLMTSASARLSDAETCFGQPATLVGTSGDDVLVGTIHKDVIVARAGKDVVRARGGDDLVCGGAGKDRLSGNEGDDRIIDGGGARDLLLGGSGDDYLVSRPRGHGSRKILGGGYGADRLKSVGSVSDGLAGGPGPDRLSSIYDAGYDEWVFGGPGLDVITIGGGYALQVYLRADGDHVRTRDFGWAQLIWYGSPGPVEVDLAAGTARLIGAAAGDTITHLESSPQFMEVFGTKFADRISGGHGDERLNGLSGSDTLSGLGGNDQLSGDQGNDVIDLGPGDDYAHGYSGRDSIYGGPGDDYASGGPGRDSVDGGPGRDTCVNAESRTSCSPERIAPPFIPRLYRTRSHDTSLPTVRCLPPLEQPCRQGGRARPQH